MAAPEILLIEEQLLKFKQLCVPEQLQVNLKNLNNVCAEKILDLSTFRN